MGEAAPKLDPVGQEDKDIDNDGDSDKTDSYLKKRRGAISAAIAKGKNESKLSEEDIAKLKAILGEMKDKEEMEDEDEEEDDDEKEMKKEKMAEDAEQVDEAKLNPAGKGAVRDVAKKIGTKTLSQTKAIVSLAKMDPKKVKEEGVAEGNLGAEFAAFAKQKGIKATAPMTKAQSDAALKARSEKFKKDNPTPKQPDPYKETYPLGGRDEKSGRSYSEEVEQVDEEGRIIKGKGYDNPENMRKAPEGDTKITSMMPGFDERAARFLARQAKGKLVKGKAQSAPQKEDVDYEIIEKMHFQISDTPSFNDYLQAALKIAECKSLSELSEEDQKYIISELEEAVANNDIEFIIEAEALTDMNDTIQRLRKAGHKVEDMGKDFKGNPYYVYVDKSTNLRRKVIYKNGQKMTQNMGRAAPDQEEN